MESRAYPLHHLYRFMGPLCLAVSLLGILAALRGPYAFVRRPALILAPLYAPGFSVDEIAEIRRILERELAAEGSHALYPKSLIENFYLERDNAADVFHGDYLGKDEAFALGEGLGVERTAIASAAKYSGRLNLTLTIYDIETDQRAGRAGFSTRNIETLEAWENTEGRPLDLAGELDIQMPGFSAGALLYLGWLAAFGILGTILCIKYLFSIDWRPARAVPDARIPRMVIETLLSCGLLLLLFAWIYALNGDMDYVQRFVATSGVLRLDDTRAERAAALIRYLPPMLLLSVLWLLDARQRPAPPQFHTLPDSPGYPAPPEHPRRPEADLLDITAPLWSILSGLLYTLSLPNFLVLRGIPDLAWIACAPLIIVLRRVRPGRGFALTLLFVGVKSLLINWWQGTFSYVSLPFTVGLTLLKYLPFAVLLPFTLGLQGFQRLSRGTGGFSTNGQVSRWGIWAVPFLWVGFDWVSSLGFLGYPWGMLGVSQYGRPVMIQAAALGGVWTVSFLTHLSGAALAAAAEGFISGWTTPEGPIKARHTPARDTPARRFPGKIRAMKLPRAARAVRAAGAFRGYRGAWTFKAARTARDSRAVRAAGVSRDTRTYRAFRAAGPPLLAAAGALGLTALGGHLTIKAHQAAEEGRNGRDIRILLVQQNTDPRKHDYALSFDELSRLTAEAIEAARAVQAAGPAGPVDSARPADPARASEAPKAPSPAQTPFDLAAWPESGFVPDIRYWLDESRSRRRRGKLVRRFLDWQAETALPLVTGNQDHFYEQLPSDDDPETPDQVKRIRNSALYLAPDRRDDFDRRYYYKIRLVPFTENFPYREQFPRIAELLHNFSTTQWTPGTEYTVLQAPRFAFSTPICFEDVFPDHVRRFVTAGAEVLVNISNDYWANTPLEGYQHGAHAIFRAVENRRPLVRATSSGWTISVDTLGRTAPNWPEFYTPGSTVAEHRIPDDPPTTLYTRLGDWFPILLLLIWAIFVSANIRADLRRPRRFQPFNARCQAEKPHRNRPGSLFPRSRYPRPNRLLFSLPSHSDSEQNQKKSGKNLTSSMKQS